MISDPKLPFAAEPAPVGELQSPAESRVPVIPAPDSVSPDSVARRSLATGSVATGSVSTPASLPHRSAARLWFHRIGVLLFVFLCATLGVMLMILPWRPEWSDNPLLLPYPALRVLIASGFARGLATGLGLLNVWIGFWEAIQYREEE
ncbi:MAG: hypothetical protein ACLQFM_11805 [Terriglobales bacterium]